MKKLILASAISAAFAGGFAQAEEAAMAQPRQESDGRMRVFWRRLLADQGAHGRFPVTK